MLWVIEMEAGGVFEAASKRKALEQMIQHYAERNEDAPQIKGIFYVGKDDRTDELCGNAIARVQDLLENGITEWRKIAGQEQRGQREIEYEIRGVIYG